MPLPFPSLVASEYSMREMSEARIEIKYQEAPGDEQTRTVIVAGDLDKLIERIYGEPSPAEKFQIEKEAKDEVLYDIDQQILSLQSVYDKEMAMADENMRQAKRDIESEIAKLQDDIERLDKQIQKSKRTDRFIGKLELFAKRFGLNALRERKFSHFTRNGKLRDLIVERLTLKESENKSYKVLRDLGTLALKNDRDRQRSFYLEDNFLKVLRFNVVNSDIFKNVVSEKLKEFQTKHGGGANVRFVPVRGGHYINFKSETYKKQQVQEKIGADCSDGSQPSAEPPTDVPRGDALRHQF